MNLIEIEKILKTLVGSRIKLNYEISLTNGEMFKSQLNDCNVVGNSLENIIFPILRNKIPTFQKGEKQKSPDFFDSNSKIEFELKAFKKSPCFDVANFNSYINQINTNLSNKVFNTYYIIYQYDIINENSLINIIDFKLLNVWNIVSFTGKYPISVQNKKGFWYNIRPCSSFKQMDDKSKTHELFINKICEAILQTPNNIPEKNKIIENIRNQYQSWLKKNQNQNN